MRSDVLRGRLGEGLLVITTIVVTYLVAEAAFSLVGLTLRSAPSPRRPAGRSSRLRPVVEARRRSPGPRRPARRFIRAGLWRLAARGRPRPQRSFPFRPCDPGVDRSRRGHAGQVRRRQRRGHGGVAGGRLQPARNMRGTCGCRRRTSRSSTSTKATTSTTTWRSWRAGSNVPRTPASRSASTAHLPPIRHRPPTAARGTHFPLASLLRPHGAAALRRAVFRRGEATGAIRGARRRGGGRPAERRGGRRPGRRGACQPAISRDGTVAPGSGPRGGRVRAVARLSAQAFSRHACSGRVSSLASVELPAARGGGVDPALHRARSDPLSARAGRGVQQRRVRPDTGRQRRPRRRLSATCAPPFVPPAPATCCTVLATSSISIGKAWRCWARR